LRRSAIAFLFSRFLSLFAAEDVAGAMLLEVLLEAFVAFGLRRRGRGRRGRRRPEELRLYSLTIMFFYPVSHGTNHLRFSFYPPQLPFRGTTVMAMGTLQTSVCPRGGEEGSRDRVWAMPKYMCNEPTSMTQHLPTSPPGQMREIRYEGAEW